MSNLGINNPVLPISTTSTITNSDIAKSVLIINQKSEVLANIIGDMNGYGNTSTNSFKSSLSESIGDASKISIDLPLGVEFEDYSESFATHDKNDFVLSLLPTKDIKIIDGLGTNYTKVEKGHLNNNNEYTLSGRRIVFHTKPSAQFTVVYKGIYPNIPNMENDGYAPNVIPNPYLVSNGLQNRPSIVSTGGGTYEITVNPTNRNRHNELFAGKLGFALNPNLAKYISPTGSIEAPSEVISVWKNFNGKYQKFNDARIFILSENKFRVSTSIPINVNSDFIVFSIANWSVADTLEAITQYMLNHRHSDSEIGSKISHSDMMGLRAERYDQSLQGYGESIIAGDDHPQYFNREGYLENPGAFNNAIIGDVLIGSSSSQNLYNNTAADSRKLVFGSMSDGTSFMYDALAKGLRLFSANNGLSIQTNSKHGDEETAFGTGLVVDGHTLSAKGGITKVVNGLIKVGNNILAITAKDGIVDFKSALGGLATINTKNINSENANFTGLVEYSKEDSGFKVGEILFSNKNGIASVTTEGEKSIDFDAKVNVSDISVESISPDLIKLGNDGKIEFGKEDSDYIQANDNIITFLNARAVQYATTGINTGFAINNNGTGTKYLKLYSSSEGGGRSTSTDHDAYIETGTGDIYLIKDTDTRQTEGTTKYIFGQDGTAGETRIDNLKQWPRSSMYAGDIDAYTVNVLQSSLKERRGVNFGDAAVIYVTGSDTECPPGWMVVESKNGVVFVDNRQGVIDCQSMTYSEITSGSIKAFGDITVDKSVGISGDLTVAGDSVFEDAEVSSTLTSGSITVREDSSFSGPARFTESVTIGGAFTLGGSATISGSINANELIINSRTILNGIASINNSLDVGGDLNVNGDLYADGDFRITGRFTGNNILVEEATVYNLSTTEKFTAKGGIDVIGSLVATGNIEAETDVIAVGGRFSGQVRAQDILVENDIRIQADTVINGKLQVEDDITLGTSSSKVVINGNSTFNNTKTSMLGNFEVTQETILKGDTSIISGLTVSGGTTLKGGLSSTGPIESTSSATFRSLTIGEQSSFAGDGYFGGRLSIGKTLAVDSDVVFRGNATIGSSSNIIIIEGRSIFNSVASFSDELRVSGDAIFSGNAEIAGGLNITSKASIEGELTANGNAVIKGIMTSSGIVSNGQATFVDGLVSEKMVTTSSLTVDDMANLRGGLNVEGDTRLNGSLTTLPESVVSVGNLNVLSALSQTDNRLLNQFAAPTKFNNDISVAGNISISGTLNLGSSALGCVIEYNSIKLNGATSILETKSIITDSIIGSKRISIPSSVGRSSEVSSKISQASNKEYVQTKNLNVTDTQVNNGDVICLGTIYVGAIQTIDTVGATTLNNNSSVMNIIAARARYAP